MRNCLVILVFLVSRISVAQTDDVFAVADSMPWFPGGNLAIGKFFVQNLRIPPEVLESGTKSEKTYVKFTVDTMGIVNDPIVVKPSNFKSFDIEATRVITSMSPWIPGSNGGRKVKVLVTLPVSFKNEGIVSAPKATKEHEDAMIFWNQGHKLEQEYKFEQALEKYNKSLTIELDNKYAMFDKGKMQMVLGQKDQACATWNKMIQNNIRKNEAKDFVKKYCIGENGVEGMVKYYNNIKAGDFFRSGTKEVQNGRYEAALNMFDSCLKYNSEYKDALFNKAFMHHKLDQKSQACATWNKLIAQNQSDIEVQDLIKKHCN